jgi:hypothetical protein
MSSSWSKLLIYELDLTLQIPSSQTGPYIFLITFLPNIRKTFSSEMFSVQVSAAYVTTGLINVLYNFILVEIIVIIVFSIKK